MDMVNSTIKRKDCLSSTTRKLEVQVIKGEILAWDELDKNLSDPDR